MTKINISIPQPCHENWEAMTAEDKGRFCGSCQKKVFDFTSSSDREIINAFEKNNNLCGRFLNSQLDRDLAKPKEKSSLWLATTTAIISLIGVNEVTAQQKAPTEQTDRRMLGKFIATPVKEIEVSGVVSDETGTLPGVNITIKGTEKSTQSDIDGKFSIKGKESETLVFQFVGMKTKEVVIENKNIINLKMKMSGEMLGEIVIAKKRTFIGRLFHKSKYRRR